MVNGFILNRERVKIFLRDQSGNKGLGVPRGIIISYLPKEEPAYII